MKLPSRLMLATEVLEAIHDQTGRNYAYPSGVLVRQVDAGRFGGTAGVGQLTALLAPTSRTEGGVLVLEAALTDARLAELADKLRSANADERRVAAYELGNTMSTRAIGPLFGALDDRDESVRHHALRSLDRMERDLASHCPAGRVSIFTVSGRLPADKLVNLLTAAPDAASTQWTWSAGLIGRLGGPTSARDALTPGLAHGYGGTRQAARWALDRLARTERPKAVKPADAEVATADLLKALADQTNPEAQAELLLRLGRRGGQEVWDLLLGKLADNDPIIRQAAIRALDRSPDPQVCDVLMNILLGADSDGDERNLAAMSLGMIAMPRVIEQLADYVRRTNAAKGRPISGVALALSWAAETGDPRVVEPLVGCVRAVDDSPNRTANTVLRSYAYIGLARAGTADAVNAIMTRYNEYDNTGRFVGHSAIRLARGQQAVDRFVELVRTGSGRIAPHGLEESEDPRAVDALIEATPKASGDRLNFALQALGRIGDPKAVPTLLGLLDHAEPWVRYEAFRALRWRMYWFRPDVQEALKKHATFKAFLAPPPSPAEQPENTWVLRHWPIDFDDYGAVNTSYEAGMAFDESAHRAVKVNAHGQRCDTPQLSETWLYDPESNTWTESASPVAPFGMCGTWGIAYDRSAGKVVYLQAEGGHHGWQWDRGRALRPSSPWVYDPAADRWTAMQPLHRHVGPGLRAFEPLVYHDRGQAVFLHGGEWGGHADPAFRGQAWLYDTYANTWTRLPPSENQLAPGDHRAKCYLPDQDKVLTAGGKGGETWLFDLATNTWTDARPAGKPPAFRLPAVFDPVSRTALVFAASANGTTIWQYDPKANAWDRVNAPSSPAPHHGSVDAVYDPANNVFIMDGGLLNWNTDHIAVREVWTYKFRDRPAGHQRPLPPPSGLTIDTRGGMTLTWKSVPDAARFVVYRGAGDVPWKVDYQRVTPEPIKATDFVDPNRPAAGQVLYYRVATVDARGVEGPPGAPVRTQPPLVGDVVASVLADRTVEVRWAASPSPGVTGYHVYAADVRAGERMHPRDAFRDAGEFKRLTERPIGTTSFVDARPIADATGLFNHELRAYHVTAVNDLGLQSGPSATVLTLAGSVPRVRAAEQPDGSTLVQWDESPERDLRGYAVYRMDEWRGGLAVRLNPVPVRGTRYLDRPEAPRAERRRYYVVAIDALNQEGIPSSGAWSFGRP